MAYITLDKCCQSIGLGGLWGVSSRLRAAGLRAVAGVPVACLGDARLPRTTVEESHVEESHAEHTDDAPLTAEAWQEELAAQRARAEELIAAQGSALDQIESELVNQLDQLSVEMGQAAQEEERDQEQWRQKIALVERRLQEAQHLKEGLDQRQERWRALQADLEAEQQQRFERLRREQQRLDHLADKVGDERTELVEQQAELKVGQAEAAAIQQRFRERLAEIEAERSELEILREETRRQRTRIAREFRRERTALHQRLAEALEAAEEASSRVVEVPAANADEEALLREEMADWQRKYGLAMEELRKVRDENEELRARPKPAPPSPAAPTTAAPVVESSSGVFDWEAEKRRLMAAFDEDGDATPAAHQDRREIEELVRRTDQLLVDKDREIARLQAELEEEREKSQTLVGNADELEQLVDADELIQQERAHLEALQEQLREKLRKAEVELSMERAKIARERAELEELASRVPDGASPSDADDGGGSPRGRWLQRLGLADDGESPK